MKKFFVLPLFLVVFSLMGCWSTPQREPSWTSPTATPTATATTMAKAIPKATITSTATVATTKTRPVSTSTARPIATAVKPTSTTRPTLPPPTQTPVLVWVRQDEVKVNPGKHPLGWDYGADPRRKNSFVKWEVSEKSFVSIQKYQEDQDIWYEGAKISVSFGPPPLVLKSGSRYEIKASFSKSAGTLNHGFEGLGETFLWTGGKVEPTDGLPYFPWSKEFNGISSKEWMLSAPPPGKVGDTFTFSAHMLNCPPGMVQWTYKAEVH